MSTRANARPWMMQLFLLVGLVIAASSCRSKTTPASGGPAGSASATPRQTGCREIRPGRVVVIGDATQRSADSEEEEAIDLPFSVELGEARAGERGFAAPAIESRAGKRFAIVAWIDAATVEGQVVDLGRMHGDLDPPAVAAHRDRWILALPVSNAGGVTLQLLSLKAPYQKADLERGAEIHSMRRDAPSFALSVTGDRGILVWSTLEKARGRLALAEFDPNGLSLRKEPALLPLAEAEDAEAPRLAARPSGYYLAYLVRTPVKSGRPLRSSDGPSDGGEEELIEEGPSGIEVIPLDVHGVPVAPARRLTPASTHVAAFEIAPLADGGALLTYREARGPGLDRPSVQAIRVRADGSSESRAWDVGDDPGLPTILVDSAPLAPERWGLLALPGERLTRFTPLGVDPLALSEWKEDPWLGASEPLALRGGQLLTALSRGTQRELSVLECGDPARGQ